MRKILFLLLACLSVAGVWAQGAKEAYTVFDGTNTLTFYYDDQKDSREGTVELLSKDDRLTSYANHVVYIVIDKSFRDYELTSTSDLFNNAMMMTYLEKVFSFSNLGNLNTDGVTDMSQMFNGCSQLAYIVCDKDWTTSEAKSNNMFEGCDNLRGEEGTKYDDQRKNITLARPDGGEGNEGYFCTHKPELYCLTTNGGKTMTCAFRKKGATGLDQTTAPEGEASKHLRNGILYIIRNGRAYDTTGRQLR